METSNLEFARSHSNCKVSPLVAVIRRTRFIFLVLGFGLILGLMLWLVLTLTQLYRSVAVGASPLLANVLVGLLVFLLLLLVAVLVYYSWLFSRSGKSRKQRSAPPELSDQKTAVADQALQAVRRQVDQIQDRVAQQALLARSQAVAQDLQRRELRIVVFGTGSAGKTSLVNALLGRVAGEVSPTLGTTTVGETYRFDLKGIHRQLFITDTPGLLEVGVAGTEREQLARELATQADLLLFVVDADLTQSEFLVLERLETIGKRLILVLNKTDRYTDDDVQAVLERLRERTAGRLDPRDIVAIAARPEPVLLEPNQAVASAPVLVPLIRRLAHILQTEGDELLADNILLQAQRLGDNVRELIDEQRRIKAERLVNRFQWIGAGAIWVTPLPVVDLLATAAVNAQMVVDLGQVYGCEINLARGKELALSLAKTLGGLGILAGAIELVTTALELSVGGYVVGKSIQSLSAAYLTRIAGKSFIEYFRNDQDWGDGGISGMVQRQFELNRRDEFVKIFIQEAIYQLPREAFNRQRTAGHAQAEERKAP